MRADLRRDCDEIWVIDCSPERHQPDVNTRFFEGVQHPVCIVLASRSPANDPQVPAKVRFRSLAKGNRKDKFAELAGIALGGAGWSDAARDWRAPFLPEFRADWANFVPLDAIINDCGLGVMPGRTWVIAPDRSSLERRWSVLMREGNPERRAALFHPHLRKGKPGDKHIAKAASALPGHKQPAESVEDTIRTAVSNGLPSPSLVKPIAYGFRSFDRQWIIPDARVINQPASKLWAINVDRQVYLTALA